MRQGPVAAATESRRNELLDPARTAGTVPRIHEKPVLSMLSILGEFATFLRVRKKFWLMPIVILMILFGALFVLTQGTAIAPFIYTLF
jgi:hypothetical protein